MKKPIGEDLKIARDILWNLRLEPSKTPMDDLANPIGRTPSPKGRKRTLVAIMAIDEERRRAWGNTPANDMFLKKLLEESGFVEIPHDRKSFEQLMDETGQDEE